MISRKFLGVGLCMAGLSLKVSAAQGLSGLVRLPGSPSVVVLTDGTQKLSIYGKAPSKTALSLLPYARRDAWRWSEASSSLVAPESSREALSQAESFWQGFWAKRFHDYNQESTRLPVAAIPVDRWVKDGDVITWQGHAIQAVSTPGYAPDAISYLMEWKGKRIAFTGEWILEGGLIPDLYSFQGPIPEARIRGYHGYAARLADLGASIAKLEAWKPDLIIPSRGAVVEHPMRDLALLRQRVQALYRNYMSSNALYWYFKQERMDECAARILGPNADYELMPYSRQRLKPDWVLRFSTTRLLVSEDGYGFLLDCGYDRVIESVQQLIQAGRIRGVEGIFVTHYHDDHTDAVRKAAEVFQCPVHALGEYADILRTPGAFRMPCVSPNEIPDLVIHPDGDRVKWRGMQLEYRFFPGQTLLHGALQVTRGTETLLFVGDAFTPSGLDDYCLMNRNLMGEGQGYFRCFDIVQDLPGDAWLMNQHVDELFQYTPGQLKDLRDKYQARRDLLAELTPWPHPNFAVDEQWARFEPYGLEARPGSTVELEFEVWNHDPAARTWEIQPRVGKGWGIQPEVARLSLQGGQAGRVRFQVSVPEGTPDGVSVLTADLFSPGIECHQWSEALIRVQNNK